MTVQPACVECHAYEASLQKSATDFDIQELALDDLSAINAALLPAIVPFLVANPGFAAGVVGGAAIASRLLR